jgi:hypothetical protein
MKSSLHAEHLPNAPRVPHPSAPSLSLEPPALVKAVRAFASDRLANAAATIDERDEIPPEIFHELSRLGVLALEHPADGGRALGGIERISLVLDVLEELAKVSPATAKAVMDQNFGQIGMLRDYAPPEVREPYLQKIQRGQLQAAFLMTEPRSGSDVRLFETVAERVAGGYVLDGHKDWITGAALRQLHFVVAKPARDSDAVGLFLVDRTRLAAGSTAIEIDDRKDKLGLRGLGEYRVRLRRVFVPDEHVILEPGRDALGKIMKHYNVKRCGQAAISVGLSRAALRTALSYGLERFPLGSPARANLDQVLTPLTAELQAAALLSRWAAEQLVDGDRTGVPSAMAKSVATELALRITNAAMQVCGANGLSKKLPIERLMRDARMLTVAGGSTEVLRGTVARHLGRLLE